MDSRGEGLRVFIWGRSIGRSGKVHQGDRCQFRENLGEIYSTFLVCEIHGSCRDTAVPCPCGILNVRPKPEKCCMRKLFLVNI